MKTGSKCLITLYLFLSSQITVVIAQPPAFALNGSAILLSENCYRITSHTAAEDVGSIWCEFPVGLAHAIDLRFAVNLGCSNHVGEGLAFVMHTDPGKQGALGCGGSFLGFGRTTDCKGIQPSLALEIDTRFNRNHKDLYYPHLALVKNGDLSNPIVAPVRAKNYGKDIRDCEYHNIRITWLPSKQELCIYFDEELRISYNEDILEDIFNGAEEVYFGFTGSSGSQANMQMICIQSLMVEVDGDFARKRSFEDAIGIYPNPLKEKLTIDINLAKEEEIKMQLYDSSGKLIYEIPEHETQVNQYYFNLPGLPSGVYYVTITNGTNRVSQKFVHVSMIRA